MGEAKNHGLANCQWDALRGVFSQYPQITKAILYGSRAKGNWHTGSDVDIVLVGEELTISSLARLIVLADDLLLPYYIDLSLYHKISNPNLIDHIDRVGSVIYEKNTMQ